MHNLLRLFKYMNNKSGKRVIKYYGPDSSNKKTHSAKSSESNLITHKHTSSEVLNTIPEKQINNVSSFVNEPENYNNSKTISKSNIQI